MKAQEYDNVWDALEEDPVQAANLKLRSKLMNEISEIVKKSGITQKEAARVFGTTQPRLNNVMRGRIEKCTVDRLVNMLSSVGYKVDFIVTNAA